MHGKKYREIEKEKSTDAVSVAEAVAFLKGHPAAKFDETVEVHINLGIDQGKSDQHVRGSVQLPSGAAKQKKIAVIASQASDQKAAQAAGAAIVGGEELIKKIMDDGSLDADVVIATPDMMVKIAPAARTLGPLGLMPNPKTGTVTPTPVNAVNDLLAGKITFKMDQLGNVHESVGKVSWEADKISANVAAILEAVRAARPATVKGQFIKSVTLATSMGPGIAVHTV